MPSEQARRLINIVRSFTNPDKPYGAPVSEMPAMIDAELQEVREVMALLYNEESRFSRNLTQAETERVSTLMARLRVDGGKENDG